MTGNSKRRFGDTVTKGLDERLFKLKKRMFTGWKLTPVLQLQLLTHVPPASSLTLGTQTQTSCMHSVLLPGTKNMLEAEAIQTGGSNHSHATQVRQSFDTYKDLNMFLLPSVKIM